LYNVQAVRDHLNKYLELGFSPVWLRGKVANYSWDDFSLTKSNMTQSLRPGINWGIRAGLLPSGVYLWFIDLDTKDLLSNALESNFALSNSPIVSTGHGFHIYCTWTKEIKTKHDRPNKIDIISRNYVVCPPSIHPSGKPYRFIRPLNGIPPLVDPESLGFMDTAQPAATSTPSKPNSIITKPVVQVLRNTSYDTATHTAAPESFDPLYCSSQFPEVQQGQRHTRLVSIIGIELARHFTEEQTMAVVLEWNKRNKPPMTQVEVVNTIRDCYQRYDVFDPERDTRRD